MDAYRSSSQRNREGGIFQLKPAGTRATQRGREEGESLTRPETAHYKSVESYLSERRIMSGRMTAETTRLRETSATFQLRALVRSEY
jgi:hypothetical protein